MIIGLFVFLLCIFAVFYIVIGKRASAKISDNEDYFLGKRGLSIIPLAFTLLGTQLGGGALLGSADEAYLKGWIVLFYPLGMCLGLIALSLGFGSKLRKLNISTVAQIFEKVYGSASLRKFVSLLSIITLFFILVAQAVGAKKFFISIGFDSSYVFFSFWAVIVLYTVLGGLKAVVNTDIIQVIFIMIVFVLVFVVSFFKLQQAPPPAAANFVELKGGIPWVSWLLMPLLFMIIEQDMGQRCFAAKNKKTIFIGGIISSILLFFCCLFSIYFGVLANKLNLNIAASKGVLMTVVASTTTPMVSTFFAVAFLMVIISTADSLLCAISSNVSFDFPFFKKVRSSQIITFVVGILAMFVSIFFNNILSILINSYELSVSILFVPIAAAIFSNKLSKNAAVFSMVVSSIGFIFFKIFEPKILPRELIVLSLSFFSFLISNYFFARRMRMSRVVGRI